MSDQEGRDRRDLPMMKIASGARGEVGFTPNSGHF